MATGLTMKAAVMAIKRQNPWAIIVAVLVTSQGAIASVEGLVDAVVAMEIARKAETAVGVYCTHFSQVTDKEVLSCLQYVKKIINAPTKNKKSHERLVIRNVLA